MFMKFGKPCFAQEHNILAMLTLFKIVNCGKWPEMWARILCSYLVGCCLISDLFGKVQRHLEKHKLAQYGFSLVDIGQAADQTTVVLSAGTIFQKSTHLLIITADFVALYWFTGYVVFIITSCLAGVESGDQCLLNSKFYPIFLGS